MSPEGADAPSQPVRDGSLQTQEASGTIDHHQDKSANPEEEALVATLEEGDPKGLSLEEAEELATGTDSEAESYATGNSSGEEFDPEGRATSFLQDQSVLQGKDTKPWAYRHLTTTVADRNLRPRPSRVEEPIGDRLEDPVTTEEGTESSEPTGREAEPSDILTRPGKANPSVGAQC